MNTENTVYLLADIGATNARLAVLENGKIVSVRIYPAAEYESLEAIIGDYLDWIPSPKMITHTVIAIAGPVIKQQVQLTNLSWKTSSRELESRFDFDHVILINDFEAIAWSIHTLGKDDLEKIGPGTAEDGATIGIIGPGSGVGISAVTFGESGKRVLTTEGGHATIPTVTSLEDEMISFLRETSGHVSIEDVLCGKGLVRLYEAACHIDGSTPQALSPAEVTARAQSGECRNCEFTLEVYYSLLGTVTGNLALTFDARGGMYLAGGILPRLTHSLARSEFRNRFESKGPFSGYLSRIGTWVVTHPYPGLLGAASYAGRER